MVDAVDLNFLTGSYQCGPTAYGSWAAFLAGAAGAAFTRASLQNYENAAGVVSSFASGVAAIGNRGLLYEAAGTNGLRNSGMNGAVPPSTMPNNWVNVFPGLTRTIATGTDAVTGLPYIDLRFAGTAGASPITIDMDSNAGSPAALSGEAWVRSDWLALTGGSLANITMIRQGAVERTSGGGSVVVATNGPDIKGLLGAAVVRVVTPLTLAGGVTTALAQPRIVINATNGAAIDFTLRIVAPQLEKNNAVSSYITTSGTAATRAVCALTLPIPTGTWDLTATFEDTSTQLLAGLLAGNRAIPLLNAPLVRRITGTIVGGGGGGGKVYNKPTNAWYQRGKHVKIPRKAEARAWLDSDYTLQTGTPYP